MKSSVKSIFLSAIFFSLTLSQAAGATLDPDGSYLNLYYEKYALEIELAIARDEAKEERDKLNERISSLKDEIILLTKKSQDFEVEKNNLVENLQRRLDDVNRKAAEDRRLEALRIKDLEKRLATLKSTAGSRERQLIEDQKTQETRFLDEINHLKNSLESERAKSTEEMTRLNNELLQWKQLTEAQAKKLSDIETQAKSMEEALTKEIKEGNLRIKRLKDRLIINIDDKILFDSGSASLKPEVLKTLDIIAGILQKYRQSRIIVEGHTDNVPIHNYRFRDNWQLSSERALSVLARILKKTELNSHRFSVQGFGQYQPAALNDTEKGRQLNRRVDIVVLPDN